MKQGEQFGDGSQERHAVASRKRRADRIGEGTHGTEDLKFQQTLQVSRCPLEANWSKGGKLGLVMLIRPLFAYGEWLDP